MWRFRRLKTRRVRGEVRQEHEGFVKDSDFFAGAILNGAEKQAGTSSAAREQALRAVVDKADKSQNDEFAPRIKSLQYRGDAGLV